MISDEEIYAFMALVDQARAQIPETITHNYFADAFNIKNVQLDHSQSIRDALYKFIRNEVVDKNTSQPFRIRSLKNALVRRSIFQPNDYSYHEIPRWIVWGVNESAFLPITNQDKWIKVILAVFALKKFSDYEPSMVSEDRNFIVANAAKRLQSRGYQLGIKGSAFFFTDGEVERCCSELDLLIKKIGGAYVIFGLLQNLKEKARFSEGRYFVGRRAQTMPLQDHWPSIPFGYLLNLSLRHMDRKTYCVKSDIVTFHEIIKLAGDIVAVMDLEVYNAWEFMSSDYSYFPKYLQGILAGDFCLDFRQIVAKDAAVMISGLFNWVDASLMEKELGWTISDAIILANEVLGKADPKQINLLIRVEALTKATGLKPQIMHRMLPHFTHKTTELNNQFLTPWDAKTTNFDSKPFIWQPGNKLLLVSPPFCSIGFYEAIAAAVRPLYKKDVSDINIGNEIEPMLGRVFQSHGIEPSVISGKYKIGKVVYDCDLAIESSNAVILFEIKKKPLTKAAMSGLTLEGILDLCLSMIKAQIQLSRQEIELMKSGHIQFENGNRIELGNRSIERIALTLIDWGSAQSHVVSNNILSMLASSTINATNISHQQENDISKINKLTKDLGIQMKNIKQLKGDSKQPFFNCLFLGIPQILFFLNGSKNADEFHKNIKTIQLISTGRLDNYHTHLYMKNMNPV
ncbi:MAG: hypothetical protein ACXV74_11270 [Methylobacter sp.]